jgi:PAS domain S-box-containing protein
MKKDEKSTGKAKPKSKPKPGNSITRKLGNPKQEDDLIRDDSLNFLRSSRGSLNGLVTCQLLSDKKGRPEDLLFLDFNDAFEIMTGLKRKVLLNNKFSDVFPDVRISGTDLLKVAGEVALTGKSALFEHYQEELNKWFSVSILSTRKEYFILLLTDVTDKTQAESQMKESEEKYRTLVELATDAVFLNQKNKITYLNPAAVKLFGATKPEQILGKTPFEVFHPDFHDLIRKRIDTMINKGLPVELTEEKLVQLNGNVVDVEVTATPVMINGERAIQAILRDITDRKKAEKEKQLAYEKTKIVSELEVLFLTASESKPIFTEITKRIYDVIGKGTVVSVSINEKKGIVNMASYAGLTVSMESITSTAGLDPRTFDFLIKDFTEEEKEILGSGKLSLFPGGLHNLSTKKIPKSAIKVLQKQLEFNSVFVMGFISHGKWLGGLFILAGEDISSYKNTIEQIVNEGAIAIHRIRAEQELIQSEEKLSKVFNNMPDVVFITSLSDGKIIEVNDSISGFPEYTKEEVLGKTTVSLNIWGNIDDRHTYLNQLAKKGRVRNFETTFRCKSGKIVESLISGEIINIQGEKCVLSVVNDISSVKEAQRFLQESEEKYRTIHEDASVGLYRTSLEGKYVSVNPALARIFGYETPEEMIGCINNVGKQQYVRPEERKDFVDTVLKTDRVANYPIEVYRKDKKKIWISINAHVVRNPDKTVRHIEGSMIDITAQKEAEEELRRSEEKYRILVETIPDGIYRSTPQGKFVEVNPALVRILGYGSKEELMSIDIKTQLYFDVADRESEVLEEKLEEIAIYPLKRKDGSKIWVEDHGWLVQDEQGNVRYHEGIIRDVTERKHMEELLKESEKMYRTLLKSSPEATVMFNSEGTVIEVSELTPGVLGYCSKSDVIGKSFLHFIPRTEIARIREIVDSSPVSGKVYNFEIQLQRKDKSTFISELSFTSIEQSDLRERSYIVILRDVSERKHMEIQFIHNARLVSLGEMATSIAHEINQPLNIISLSLDNILSEIQSDKPVDQEYMKTKADKIFNNIERIRHIIDHVRAFSRDHEDYEASLFDIHESIGNAVSMVSEQFKHKAIELSVDLDKKIGPLLGNMYKFEQVILNLLGNAKDAVEERKEITLIEYRMMIDIRTYRENDHVIIAIKDNGIGIKTSELDKVLQPFYTTKIVGKGTGLGLAICYRIVTEMNGTIDIESKRYEGTTFKVKLPVVKEENEN